METNKIQKLEELREYVNTLSDKYHAKYTNQVRGIMYNIKRKGNLTNEELGVILGIPETKIESMLHETWDGHVSTKLVTKLQLLSCGVFGLPGCQMRKAEIDTIDNYFDQILCPVDEEEVEEEQQEPASDMIEKLLGVFDGDSEFQDNIRKRYKEYRERAARAAKDLENKYEKTKKTVNTAKKVAEAVKTLNEFNSDIKDHLSAKFGGVSNAAKQEAENTNTNDPKFESKSDTKVDGINATINIGPDEKVTGKAYYIDKDGKLKPISIEEAFKKFSSLMDSFLNSRD